MPITVNGLTIDENGNVVDQSDQSQDPETDALVQKVIERNQPWRQDELQQVQPQPEAQPDQAQPPDWYGQNVAEYLQQNPDHHVLDAVGDSAVHDAMMPDPQALPWYVDKSNPQSLSRAGKLVKVLMALGQGAMAGRAGSEAAVAQSGGHRSGGIGIGYEYGMRAAQNLQALQQQRQTEQDISKWRQANTARIQAQTSAFPAQQAALAGQRDARTNYLNAEAKKLQMAPADKLVHTYQGADGNIHYSYAKPDGTIYEKVGGAFYEKPEKPAAPQRPLLIHGPDHSVWLLDPQTGHSRKVMQFPNAPQRRAGPDYWPKVDAWKNKAWQNVLNDETIATDEARTKALQGVQDHYERLIKSGGGSVSHYDVASGAIAAPYDGNPESGLPADGGETLPAAPQSFWSAIPGAVRRH